MSEPNAVASFVIPYVVDYVADMIHDSVSPGSVDELRQKALTLATDFIKTNNLPFGDNLVKSAIAAMFTPENFELWGKRAIDLAKEIIIHTETKWDDFGLPLLDVLYKACEELSPNV